MFACGAWWKMETAKEKKKVSLESIMKEKHKLIHAPCPRPVLARDVKTDREEGRGEKFIIIM